MTDAASRPATGTDEDQSRSEAWYALQEYRLLLHRLRGLPDDERSRLQGRFAQRLVAEPFLVDTPRGRLAFTLLGEAAASRARSVLTKQPQTVAWIERFAPGSVFWDVGANIGVYTLYAALRGDTRVVAIEPAAVNHFLLSANCEVNRFDDRVQCLQLGLGRRRAVGALEVSQFASGRSFTFRGTGDEHPGRQAALLLSIDELVEEFGLACPNYLKLDVRALTEDIIEGGARTLGRDDVREVHMELRPDSKGGRRITERLAAFGLTLSDRHDHGAADVTFVRA